MFNILNKILLCAKDEVILFVKIKIYIYSSD